MFLNSKLLGFYLEAWKYINKKRETSVGLGRAVSMDSLYLRCCFWSLDITVSLVTTRNAQG